jgi:Secretion system C-terminal sorting domain
MNFLRSILLTLSLMISLTAFCQPDYDFSRSSLISGTDNQTGAVYLFKTVKPGVDATVTIKNMTGGIVLNNIDGGSGYKEALQPIIDVAPNSTGYVEFDINFFVKGTNTPMIQTQVPVTPIDIDGQTFSDGKVNEFDQVQLTNGYVNFDMAGKELKMEINNAWVKGTNITSRSYNSVDTTPRQVMFTVINAAISKFTFRTGAVNTSSSVQQRLRSVYFKKFVYPNAFLAVSPLASFNGVTKNDKVKLQWNILPDNSLKEVIIEKAYDPAQFASVAEIWMNTENPSNGNFNFNDNASLQGTVYYRLKMIDASGKAEYSNILVFRPADNKKQAFKMYPSVINDNVTVNITADKNEQTSLQVVDLSGRTVYQVKISLQQGQNNVAVNGFSSIHQGTYIAVVKTGNTIYSQKIMIQ